MSDTTLAILLCTYNGGKYIDEQLDSIQNQDFLGQIDIWVSDDGSNDDTLERLSFYQKKWTKGRFTIRSGPKRGFAANFLSLCCDASIQADYFAFSDQDDIWEFNKLSRAISKLADETDGGPVLYCSRTRLISNEGKELNRLSPLFTRSPDFRNALVQNLAGGNTMVFNKTAKCLLVEAGQVDVVSHDWWTYMLVTGAGGEVFYDEVPSTRYRQHDNNLIGANHDWGARLTRVRQLLNGRFQNWNELNLKALDQARYLLTLENQYRLDLFIALRQTKILRRLIMARKVGLYRQTYLGNLALHGAMLLNKV
jgi:glycosyltransferase involved in cell wall biosynthesis